MSFHGDHGPAEDADHVGIKHSTGIMTISAIMLGNTRNSMGGMPNVRDAQISSLTCIVPSWRRTPRLSGRR